MSIKCSAHLCLALVYLIGSASVASAPAISGQPKNAAPSDPGPHATDSVFRRYTTAEGFPTGTVTAIAQDGDGFLWIGTESGLLRWDGNQVLRYTADAKVPGRLRDNFIQTLCADDLGRLWIGTGSAGLASYDRDTDSFISYAVGAGGVGDVRVTAIADDGAKGVWIGTAAGLDHLLAGGSFAHLRHQATDPASLPDDRIASLMRDPQGGLWIGMASGLVRRDPLGTLVRVPLPAADGRQPDVESLLQDSRGKIWIGTAATGAYVYDPFAGIAHPLHDNTDPQFEKEKVGQIVEARPGEVWLGTVGDGIVAVDSANSSTRRIRHDPRVPATLANDTVHTLYRDRSGLLWTGTNAGLSRADPAQLTASYQPPLVVTQARIGGRLVAVAALNDDSAKQPLTVAADANSLSFEFAVLDFTAPEQNRYAHRLDGFDTQWIQTDATHRVVAYANLPPGDYVLRLRGSNREGVWSERQLAIPIHVLPTFRQSIVFRFLLVCIGVLSIYGIVRTLREGEGAAKR